MTNPEDDIKLIDSTLHACFAQFGEMKPETKLVLETIFEILFEERDDISVHGKTRQEGNPHS
jgi:hypothetical protein